MLSEPEADHGVGGGSRRSYNSSVVWEAVAFQKNHRVGFQERNFDLADLGIEGPPGLDHRLNTSNWTHPQQLKVTDGGTAPRSDIRKKGMSL